MDALSLLKADHDKVKKLFKEFDRLHEDEEDDRAETVAMQICNERKIRGSGRCELLRRLVGPLGRARGLSDRALPEKITTQPALLTPF